MLIYPSDFENKIGFDVLRGILSGFCVSPAGRANVERMAFSSDPTLIRKMLLQVDEMKRLLDLKTDIPSVPASDIGSSLARLRTAGSYISSADLFSLLGMLMAVVDVQRFFASRADDAENRLASLVELFSSLPDCSPIIRMITAVVDKFGEIRDNASPDLARIRSEIRSVSSSVSSVMRRVLEKYVSAGLVSSDSSPAMRDNRLCIPVVAMNKRKINGIVHDQSASGQTFFIEPAEVVETSNRLRELQLEEKQEIIRILISVADSIRPHIDLLAEAVEALGLYDFIMAKARLALLIDAARPVVHDKPEIEWYHAVHPVLLLSLRKQNRETVAQDIRLSPENRILVISGPNAGGKSVCLKTVGIVQYMMQCGLLPPLYSNSHMGVFKSIFVDIGDQQSLENDLSTYSSHLRNMKQFIRHASPSMLFLADEMGSRTEPQIGGALAQAILLDLNRKGARGVVTTHFQNLKTLADTVPGFVNGAMLYDRQHLRPLFKLSVGVAGSSFALEIARNIGLPADIIDSAKEIVGAGYVDMDKYLSDIARDRRYWADKRLAVREKERRLENAVRRYEDDILSLDSQRSAILKEAKKEAGEIISSANARLENTIHEIRKADAEKNRTRELRSQLEQYRTSLDSSADPGKPKILRKSEKIARSRKPSPDPSSAGIKKIEAGDFVKISDGSVAGKVISVSGKNAEVAFGNLRTKVALSKLVRTSAPKKSFAPVAVVADDSQSRNRQLNFRQEIDIRGMRADEALQAVTYFIDDAIQFSASRVRILHGTGHGILRDLVRRQLAATPGVASFSDEDVRFGGAGITVVNLDDR